MTRCSRRWRNRLIVPSRKCWRACRAKTSKKAWRTLSKSVPRLSPADKEPRVNFGFSDKVKGLQHRLQAFLDEHIYPNEQRFYDEIEQNRWSPTRIIEELKPKARAAGLWNLFLPDSEHGARLTNLEYAPLCEMMGRSVMAPEVFNCSAPDTGNMEVLARYGTPEQKERWLKPLLAGEIRSAYAMTEPNVASSDAKNISTTAKLVGDEWVINGEKYYISG